MSQSMRFVKRLRTTSYPKSIKMASQMMTGYAHSWHKSQIRMRSNLLPRKSSWELKASKNLAKKLLPTRENPSRVSTIKLEMMSQISTSVNLEWFCLAGLSWFLANFSKSATHECKSSKKLGPLSKFGWEYTSFLGQWYWRYPNSGAENIAIKNS